jgi:hypothetical protein
MKNEECFQTRNQECVLLTERKKKKKKRKRIFDFETKEREIKIKIHFSIENQTNKILFL